MYMDLRRPAEQGREGKRTMFSAAITHDKDDLPKKIIRKLERMTCVFVILCYN